MSNKNTSKRTDEQRADLRFALYTFKKENENKTYAEIGREFGVSASEAKDLVIEYCKLLNLPQPIEATVKNIYRKEKLTENLEKELIIEGRKCFIVSEMENVFVVRFYDNNESETVRKDSLSISRLAEQRYKP